MMKRHWNKINWLSSLIVKKHIGQLSEKDNKELDLILENENILRSGTKYTDASYLADRLTETPDFDKKKAYQQFCKKAYRANVRPLSIKVYRFAAVASILVLAATSYLVFTEKKIQYYNSVKQVVVPNRNVMLKMADGKELNLDLKKSHLKEADGTSLVVDSGLLVYQQNNEKTEELLQNEIRVPRGGEYLLKMADGTKVWINSESSIKYPVNFIGKQREVFVEGEVFFKVAKDKSKPFVVNTSMGKITVLGTEFNVRDYKDENKMVATLVEGSVKYTDKRGNIPSRIMEPEYQIVASSKLDDVVYKKVDLIEFVGWKDGLYVFKDNSLEEIMTTIERWYDVNVFYANSDLKTIRFSGDLKRFTSIYTLLDLMEKSGDVKFKIKENTITVIGK